MPQHPTETERKIRSTTCPAPASRNLATPPWLHGGKRRENALPPGNAAGWSASPTAKIVDLAAVRRGRRARIQTLTPDLAR
ncbi:MAG: hypothetical protein R3D02_07290 [Hyphomicrobiales bacterium]